MIPSARVRPGHKALFGLLAVNVVCAIGLSELIALGPGRWGRLALFLVSVVVLFALNRYLARAMPRFRGWFHAASALNLAAAATAGVIAFLPNVGLVARAVLALARMAAERIAS